MTATGGRLIFAAAARFGALPYTDEFDRLYSEHATASGERLTKQQYWRKISNAAKRCGWKGKNRGESAPDLSCSSATYFAR